MPRRRPGTQRSQIMVVREPDLLRRLTLSDSPVEASWPTRIVKLDVEGVPRLCQRFGLTFPEPRS